MLHAVVMAGGSGTRFWPQSRARRPKQFLRVAGEQTLLEATLGRVAGWIPPERTWIAASAAHTDLTARQLPTIGRSQIIEEPCGRNTAPCIGLAALQILANDPDGTMLVMPADHLIAPIDGFRRGVERAVAVINGDPSALVLFGIPPRSPSVNFGYIERSASAPTGPQGAFRVASFREKPDRATAARFLAAGTFYWNSGIFVWKAAAIRSAIKRFEPEIDERLSRLASAVGTASWNAALQAEFPKMPSISIDYAVLERADNVWMCEAPFEWDDVGSWQAVARLRGVDADGNCIEGPCVGIESRGCIVQTTPDHLVAMIGLNDCIVVHTADATLIARKDDEEAIRKLVEILRERGDERFL